MELQVIHTHVAYLDQLHPSGNCLHLEESIKLDVWNKQEVHTYKK